MSNSKPDGFGMPSAFGAASRTDIKQRDAQHGWAAAHQRLVFITGGCTVEGPYCSRDGSEHSVRVITKNENRLYRASSMRDLIEAIDETYPGVKK